MAIAATISLGLSWPRPLTFSHRTWEWLAIYFHQSVVNTLSLFWKNIHLIGPNIVTDSHQNKICRPFHQICWKNSPMSPSISGTQKWRNPHPYKLSGYGLFKGKPSPKIIAVNKAQDSFTFGTWNFWWTIGFVKLPRKLHSPPQVPKW